MISFKNKIVKILIRTLFIKPNPLLQMQISNIYIYIANSKKKFQNFDSYNVQKKEHLPSFF